ncbi:MAG TPA: PIN domain-containing protein [Polyangiaceae bacterium]|jgi:tRNA(fMet)-specific endonuclease VapC|nr:PIN domain-containing protein [Polyangiaceae bacterium]
MKTYMLDTDTVSFALRGIGDVAKRILRHKPSHICISAITLAELRFGVDKKRSPKLEHLVDSFVRGIHIAPFDDAAAIQFGKVASALSGSGRPIGELDSLIAAHAIALGAILVTNNIRHFGQVAGLHTENWA